MLSDIQKVRLEIGDTQNPPFQIMSDEEVQYFLDKNSQSVRRASLDCAKSVLFKLASQVDERADILELFGSQYFRAYKEALMVYLKDQNFSVINYCQPYAGGISVNDIAENIQTTDNNFVDVQRGIPQELDGLNNNTDVYSQVFSLRNDSFSA